MSGWTVSLRRSPGRHAAPVLFTVLIAQVLIRDRAWTYEWTWALYQLAFNTVLLSPIVAGLGAWEGARLADSSDYIGTCPRSWRVALSAWLGLILWTAVVYLVGVVVVALLVLARGTPFGPRLVDTLTILTAIGLMAAFGALGIGLGWLIRRRLAAAPLAAALTFCTTLWLYLAGPGQFVTVGGASGSLAGATPNTTIQWRQVAVFVGISITLLLLISRRTSWGVRGPVVLGLFSTLATTIAVVGLADAGQAVLVPYNEPVTCTGVKPQVCAVAGYARFGARAHDDLAPLIHALEAAKVSPIPLVFNQNASPGQVLVGPLQNRFLTGNTSDAALLVSAAYVDKRCFLQTRREDDVALFGLQWWLAGQVGGDRGNADLLPEKLTKGTPADQAAFIRDAVHTLVNCYQAP